jgi:pseudouridine-5'-phosphate glycosidase
MHEAGVQGGDVTTWMIKRLAKELGEDSVLGNIELLIFNATIAAQIATALHDLYKPAI